MSEILRIPVDRELSERAMWLVTFRWLVLTAATVFVLLANFWLGNVLPQWPLLVTLGTIGVYNLLSLGRLLDRLDLDPLRGGKPANFLQEVADGFMAGGNNPDSFAIAHQVDDHARPGVGFAGPRRPLYRQAGLLQRKRQPAGRGHCRLALVLEHSSPC